MGDPESRENHWELLMIKKKIKKNLLWSRGLFRGCEVTLVLAQNLHLLWAHPIPHGTKVLSPQQLRDCSWICAYEVTGVRAASLGSVPTSHQTGWVKGIGHKSGLVTVTAAQELTKFQRERWSDLPFPDRFAQQKRVLGEAKPAASPFACSEQDVLAVSG